jgi:hypothetical protein
MNKGSPCPWGGPKCGHTPYGGRPRDIPPDENGKIQFPRVSTLVESLGNHFFEEVSIPCITGIPCDTLGCFSFLLISTFKGSLMLPQADFEPEMRCAAR